MSHQAIINRQSSSRNHQPSIILCVLEAGLGVLEAGLGVLEAGRSCKDHSLTAQIDSRSSQTIPEAPGSCQKLGKSIFQWFSKIWVARLARRVGGQTRRLGVQTKRLGGWTMLLGGWTRRPGGQTWRHGGWTKLQKPFLDSPNRFQKLPDNSRSSWKLPEARKIDFSMVFEG